ncbi:MAG: GAF domain-containing protein [bacterium]
MSALKGNTKSLLPAYLRTIALFLAPLLLISSFLVFLQPYHQKKSIAIGCESLFESRAVEFFLDGGLNSILSGEKDGSELSGFFGEEFDIHGLYRWDGHWVNLISTTHYLDEKITPSEITRNSISKHNVYFLKQNRKALDSDIPLYYAAEMRGGKLFLVSARLNTGYAFFLQAMPGRRTTADVLLLLVISGVFAVALTFLTKAFINEFALKIRRSTASAEFSLPSPILVGLENVGKVAIESAKSAYEARQQKRNILLQKQSEFDSERKDFSIVREIAQATAAASDLRSAAFEALVPLMRKTGARCGAIFRIRNNKRLELIGENNLPADLAEALSSEDSEITSLRASAEDVAIDNILIMDIPGAEGNPILSLQGEGLTNVLCIRLRIKNRDWGVIHLYTAGSTSFESRDRALMLAVADEIALILENKGLLAKLDERIKESLSYYEFSKVLISTNDFDMLLENILWLIHENLGVPFCSVLIANDEEQMLYVRAMWGYGQEHRNMKIPYGQGLTGWVVQNGEAALVKNVKSDPRYLEGFEWVTSELAVPLIADGKIIGVLDCESNEAHQLDESDLRFMSMFADPSALAIKRALDYTEMSRKLVLDPVTKLYNRRYFDNLIDSNGEELLLRHGKVSVAFISVSNLGEINNVYGYIAGDIIIKQVAKMLASLFPEGIISRYGQSEFLVLLPGVGEEAMLRMVDELRALREEWMAEHPDAIPIAFSQGYATTNRYDELRNLVYRADSQAAHYRRQNNNQNNSKG